MTIFFLTTLNAGIGGQEGITLEVKGHMPDHKFLRSPRVERDANVLQKETPWGAFQNVLVSNPMVMDGPVPSRGRLLQRLKPGAATGAGQHGTQATPNPLGNVPASPIHR